MKQVHRAEGAHERQRNCDRGDEGRGKASQKEEDHGDDQGDAQHQFKLDVMDRCPDACRAIGHQGHVHRGWKAGGELRQSLLYLVDRGDDVGAGLPLNVQQNGRRDGIEGAIDGAETTVFRALHDLRYITKADWRATAIRHDLIAIVGWREELVVGVYGVRARRTIERSLGPVGICGADRCRQIRQCQTIGRQLSGIGLDAHGGSLTTTDRDQTDTAYLRDLLRQLLVGERLDIRERHCPRSEGKREHRCIGRVDLGIDRRGRQVRGQKTGRCIDRRLNLLLGDIQPEVEIELQGDYRGAARADR